MLESAMCNEGYRVLTLPILRLPALTPDSLDYSKNMADTKCFKNKVCLVTGGTRGIGRAIAEMLLAEDALVVVCSQRPESVEQALTEMEQRWPGKVKGKAADVRDYEAVRGLFAYVDQAFGGPDRPSGLGLDVLVNNAGIGNFGKVSGLSLDQWNQTIGTNLNGAFFCSREALFRFEARGAGYIVNISSLAGKNAFAGGAAYNASKFGLNGFSEALMLDARYDNVRVSTILPGSVATQFGHGSGAAGDLGEDWKVHPADVAAAVRMVLSMPERSMISQLEIRPSQPKRK
jgi:NAD(P)-dependent dehydrogenase (short-subunit alcohol dehydrogenase family)